MNWDIDIEIQKINGDEIIMKTYYATNVFETENQAIYSCLEFGKKIIDGEFNGMFPPT